VPHRLFAAKAVYLKKFESKKKLERQNKTKGAFVLYCPGHYTILILHKELIILCNLSKLGSLLRKCLLKRYLTYLKNITIFLIFFPTLIPLSGVGTTGFHYVVVKIRQFFFTTGRLPDVNPP
jgi:hypothetical protein